MSRSGFNNLDISGKNIKSYSIASAVIHIGMLLLFVFITKQAIAYYDDLKDKKDLEAAQEKQEIIDTALAEEVLENDIAEILEEMLDEFDEDLVDDLVDEIMTEELKEEIIASLDKKELDDEEYLAKLIEKVQEKLEESLNKQKDDELEQELLDKLVFEDMPTIDNKLDNALKKDTLETLTAEAIAQKAREVAKNTKEDLRKQKMEARITKKRKEAEQYEKTKNQEINNALTKLETAKNDEDINEVAIQAEVISSIAKEVANKLKLTNPFEESKTKENKSFKEELANLKKDIQERSEEITALEKKSDEVSKKTEELAKKNDKSTDERQQKLNEELKKAAKENKKSTLAKNEKSIAKVTKKAADVDTMLSKSENLSNANTDDIKMDRKELEALANNAVKSQKKVEEDFNKIKEAVKKQAQNELKSLATLKSSLSKNDKSKLPELKQLESKLNQLAKNVRELDKNASEQNLRKFENADQLFDKTESVKNKISALLNNKKKSTEEKLNDLLEKAKKSQENETVAKKTTEVSKENLKTVSENKKSTPEEKNKAKVDVKAKQDAEKKSTKTAKNDETQLNKELSNKTKQLSARVQNDVYRMTAEEKLNNAEKTKEILDLVKQASDTTKSLDEKKDSIKKLSKAQDKQTSLMKKISKDRKNAPEESDLSKKLETAKKATEESNKLKSELKKSSQEMLANAKKVLSDTKKTAKNKNVLNHANQKLNQALAALKNKHKSEAQKNAEVKRALDAVKNAKPENKDFSKKTEEFKAKGEVAARKTQNANEKTKDLSTSLTKEIRKEINENRKLQSNMTKKEQVKNKTKEDQNQLNKAYKESTSKDLKTLEKSLKKLEQVKAHQEQVAKNLDEKRENTIEQHDRKIEALESLAKDIQSLAKDFLTDNKEKILNKLKEDAINAKIEEKSETLEKNLASGSKKDKKERAKSFKLMAKDTVKATLESEAADNEEAESENDEESEATADEESEGLDSEDQESEGEGESDQENKSKKALASLQESLSESLGLEEGEGKGQGEKDEEKKKKDGGKGQRGAVESNSKLTTKLVDIIRNKRKIYKRTILSDKTKREILTQNKNYNLPKEPPILRFAKPTANGKVENPPTPSAQVYVGKITKREGPKLNPERKRKAHPKFIKGDFHAIPHLNKSPVIDAIPSEWNLKKSKVGSAQKVHFAWRPEGLYIYASVRDKSSHFERGSAQAMLSSFWEYDVIELWLDMKNAKSGNTAKNDCQQFFLAPSLPGGRRKAELREVIWSTRGVRAKKDRSLSEGKRIIASKIHSDRKGYDLECFISRANIRNLEFFKAGQVLGFLYVIDHGPNHNLEDGSLKNYKHGYPYSENPKAWGNLQLLGTDAKITTLAANGKPTDYPSVEISQPLGIMVTDQDSNTDTASVNYVVVRVKNRYGFNGKKMDNRGNDLGDWEDIRLRETGKSTGIFKGWISTTLMPSTVGDNKLGVQPGDILDVKYNDYVKMAGEYNKKLNVEVHVTSPVLIVNGANTFSE
ncbi:MAG: hypothetical protein COA79_06055 [Planctomycetota bacterium]|nr:MAG: hypothetical protein COA79_06055 [Planctomycetota bacterium]